MLYFAIYNLGTYVDQKKIHFCIWILRFIMHRVWISNSVQLINTGFMRRSNHRRLVIFSPAFMRTPSLAKLNFTFDDQNTQQKNRLDADFSQNQMATVTFVQTIGSCNFLNAWTKWTGKPSQIHEYIVFLPTQEDVSFLSSVWRSLEMNIHIDLLCL